MLKSALTLAKLTLAGIALAAVLSSPAGAQGSQKPQKGANYVELTPAQPTDSPGKVEVVEFFWYGCPHCYKLEPLVNLWEKKLPKDAVFKRVPAVFNEQWGIAAQVYYTLDALNEEHRLRAPLFDAIHKENLKITDESDVTAWMGKHGVDPARYKATFHSFAVQTALNRATQMTKTYGITGVPTFVVQGRYVAGAELNGDEQPLLDVTSYLIDEVKKGGSSAEKAAAPKKKVAAQ